LFQKIQIILRNLLEKILGMRVLEISKYYWKWPRKKVTEFVV
jgi:hypothetical protein